MRQPHGRAVNSSVGMVEADVWQGQVPGDLESGAIEAVSVEFAWQRIAIESAVPRHDRRLERSGHIGYAPPRHAMSESEPCDDPPSRFVLGVMGPCVRDQVAQAGEL